MAGTVVGRNDWNAHDDEDGHRNYDVEWLIRCTRFDDGPATIRGTPNLPVIGSPWRFGRDDDPFAWCHPGWRIEPVVTKEKGFFWTVQQKFSTRPLDTGNGGGNQCPDREFETPLQEPPHISGSFVKYTKEVMYDRNKKVIRTTSHEPLDGKDREFDHNRPQVIIELNSLIIPLSTFARMVDTVNDVEIWGLDPRMVKLSDVSWSREVFGTCEFYFKIRYVFDIDFKTFDKEVPSHGNRCLLGYSPGSLFRNNPVDPLDDATYGTDLYKNPEFFESYLDVGSDRTMTFLGILGIPVSDPEDAYKIKVEHYPESNFFELGIPPDLLAA